MKTLPVGTRIISLAGECDEGVMSTDDTNTYVERNTGPNAIGTITRVDQRRDCLIYHVEFEPSEVWVCLDPEELADPTKYTVLDQDEDDDWLDDEENADTLADWRQEVSNGDTSRSYEDWLEVRREQNADRRAYLAKQNR